MCKKSEEIMKALEQNINDYPKDFYRENAFLIDFHGIKNGEYEIDEDTMKMVKELEKEFLEKTKDAKLEITCTKVGDSKVSGGVRNLTEWFVYEANLGPYRHSFAMEHKTYKANGRDHCVDRGAVVRTFSMATGNLLGIAIGSSMRHHDIRYNTIKEYDKKCIVPMSNIETNLKEPELQGNHSFSEFAFPGSNGSSVSNESTLELDIKDNLLIFLQQTVLCSERYDELSKELNERDAATACLMEMENPQIHYSTKEWVDMIVKNNIIEKEYYNREMYSELTRIQQENDLQGFKNYLKNIDRPYLLNESTKKEIEEYASQNTFEITADEVVAQRFADAQLPTRTEKEINYMCKDILNNLQQFCEISELSPNTIAMLDKEYHRLADLGMDIVNYSPSDNQEFEIQEIEK